MQLSVIQKKLLHSLIDRYENRLDYGSEEKNRRRTVLKIDIRRFPDYYHPSDATCRRTFNAEMEQLQSESLIELDWERYSEGEQLKRAALIEEALPRIYRALQRRSKKELYLEALSLAVDWSSRAPLELENFYREVLSDLKNMKSLPASLNPKRGSELSNIFKGLHAVFEPREKEISKRLLSTRLYGDSKKWETMESSIIKLIEQYCPFSVESAGGSEYLLAEKGLVVDPVLISLAGPLNFSTKAGRVDLKAFYPDVGLSSEMAAELKVESCPATAVVTVENKASYYQYLRFAPTTHLVIYLGGYHNPPRRMLLIELNRFFQKINRPVPFYHWGDIDYGGISIWHKLTETTGIDFQPLYMDEETYLKHLSYGQSLDDAYLNKLALLLQNPALEIFHPLIRLILKYRLRIEQEALEI